MKTLAAICLAISLCHGISQAQKPTTTTADTPAIRYVNGTAYNVRDDDNWEERTFEFLRRTNNLVIAVRIQYKDIYEDKWFGSRPSVTFRQSINASAPSENYGQTRYGWQNVKVRTERKKFGTVAITNLTRADLVLKKEFKIATMISGETQLDGRKIALHDVGTLKPAMADTAKLDIAR